MKRKPYRRNTSLGIHLLLILALGGCPLPVDLPEETTTATPTSYEQRLILNNATLENADEAGNVVWKIQVKRAVYQDETKNAVIETVTGNFLQDGEVVLKLSADGGEITNEGQQIVLRDNIVATDPRNGVVLRCNLLYWFPEEGRVQVEEAVDGSNAELRVEAKTAQYWTADQRIEAKEEVVITGIKTPMQARSEEVVWEIPAQKVRSKTKIAIDRYDPPPATPVAEGVTPENSENSEPSTSEPSEPSTSEPSASETPETPATKPVPPVVSDRIIADQAEFNLEQQIVRLTGNVESRSMEPPMQIASNAIVWNLVTRIVRAEKPVTVIDREAQITMTANQGIADLEAEVVRVSGGARGINARRPADLYANQIVWQIRPQQVEAMGDVIYQQTDPPLHLTGSRAVGTLHNQRIVVSGGGSSASRVTTIIVP
ncbi:LPS export ABC transporter periplasmic protein LptC [Spirulina sp. CCNP1310]|uniref:LPS export ABC transporter periplasmic protein LptC n=1 Tax=Spirulina sp. CCNP1310 TaxID=3110249 RepID=UPI002B1EE778|nr:LPS export ABC transporter periplasmic protein LptC [Spirulina sp. CCNP1310]MEA5417888.1 LPS export ABC transporter periplasmic protein LptC [Spirulina sp. CCNP1310]